MPITSLRMTNFRNFSSAELQFSENINLIIGNNGSGKTSLLEAIYYLSMGRSFRSSQQAKLIRHATDKFALHANAVSKNRHFTAIGLERDLKGNVRMRMAERDITSATALTTLLPIRLLNSQSHQFFDLGPLYRRKYLDWGLFYHSDNFLEIWRNFERALKQRNSILRAGRSKSELNAWTEELILHGLKLHELRKNYVVELAPHVTNAAQALLNVSPVHLTYHSGWHEQADFRAELEANYQDDYRVGFTQLGPHRADLSMTVNGLSPKHFLSRGQQKLLICAMILAQGSLMATFSYKGIIYLIDDLPSELDFQSKNSLIALLLKQSTQMFITAIESGFEREFGTINESAMQVFHVEHGQVIQKTKDKKAQDL